MSSAQVAAASGGVVAAEDEVRAQIYRLLAVMLSAPADRRALAMGAELLGDQSEFGRAVDALALSCRQTSPEQAANEYQSLFIGLGRGELVPYGSYYLTGFLQEKPLARLRADMGRLGVVRNEGSSEPEDHIASVLETMAGLIDGAFGPQLTVSAQKLFFDAHVGSWAPQFFKDLEASPTSALYAAIGRVGARFMAIEDEAFRLAG